MSPRSSHWSNVVIKITTTKRLPPLPLLATTRGIHSTEKQINDQYNQPSVDPSSDRWIYRMFAINLFIFVLFQVFDFLHRRFTVAAFKRYFYDNYY